MARGFIRSSPGWSTCSGFGGRHAPDSVVGMLRIMHYEAQPFLPEGMKIIFHTDGLVWELTEDLIAVGVNALHPIDPTCMDIEEDKERVGDCPCIIGNISNELLETCLPEEVTELTKKRLRRISPRGWILPGCRLTTCLIGQALRTTAP